MKNYEGKIKLKVSSVLSEIGFASSKRGGEIAHGGESRPGGMRRAQISIKFL